MRLDGIESRAFSVGVGTPGLGSQTAAVLSK